MDFEQEILNGLHDGIRKTIVDRLASYGSPLVKMIVSVMEKNEDAIIAKMDKALKSVINNPTFEKTLKEEFTHKVARTLLSSLEGSIDKAANAFKQNPKIKAKMILAIQKIIDGKPIAEGGER